MKILLPVDGSECALRAVDFVIRNAGTYREAVELLLLTVHPPIPYQNAIAALGKEKVNQYYHDEGIEALKSARAKLDAAKVAYHFHIGVGDPAEVIAQYAKEKGVDQIVIGTHGRGQMGTALLGSVAGKVIQRAPVPVLLVK
ncbi:MAG: universal stress protein [Burkholderiales bacterium]